MAGWEHTSRHALLPHLLVHHHVTPPPSPLSNLFPGLLPLFLLLLSLLFVCATSKASLPTVLHRYCWWFARVLCFLTLTLLSRVFGRPLPFPRSMCTGRAWQTTRIPITFVCVSLCICDTSVDKVGLVDCVVGGAASPRSSAAIASAVRAFFRGSCACVSFEDLGLRPRFFVMPHRFQ